MEHVLLKPIGKIITGREAIKDDFWRNELSIIKVDSSKFSPDVLMGLIDFSHLEVIYFMHGVKEETN